MLNDDFEAYQATFHENDCLMGKVYSISSQTDFLLIYIVKYYPVTLLPDRFHYPTVPGHLLPGPGIAKPTVLL